MATERRLQRFLGSSSHGNTGKRHTLYSLWQPRPACEKFQEMKSA